MHWYFEQILARLEASGQDVIRRFVDTGVQPAYTEAWHKGKLIAPKTGEEFNAWIWFDEDHDYRAPYALVKIGKRWFAQDFSYAKKVFKKHGLENYEYRLNVPLNREQ